MARLLQQANLGRRLEPEQSGALFESEAFRQEKLKLHNETKFRNGNSKQIQLDANMLSDYGVTIIDELPNEKNSDSNQNGHGSPRPSDGVTATEDQVKPINPIKRYKPIESSEARKPNERRAIKPSIKQHKPIEHTQEQGADGLFVGRVNMDAKEDAKTLVFENPQFRQKKLRLDLSRCPVTRCSRAS